MDLAQPKKRNVRENPLTTHGHQKALVGERDADREFCTEDYHPGTTLQVLEENGEWKHCTLFRDLQEESSRVVLWFGGDVYEGVGDVHYTMDEEGVILDGDGNQILHRRLQR